MIFCHHVTGKKDAELVIFGESSDKIDTTWLIVVSLFRVMMCLGL